MPSRHPIGWRGKPVVKFTWRGADVEAEVNKATVLGINDTINACVDQAKLNAPVLTGALRDDIQVLQSATMRTKRITASWGNREVLYSFFQEFGTVNNPPRYYLQRAADQEYPRTNDRIRRHLRGNS
jgi:hypothetical protein